MSATDPINIEPGSLWFDTYNYGPTKTEHARIVRVEPDDGSQGERIPVRVVGGTKISQAALGRVSHVHMRRFGKSGGLMPATDTTRQHVHAQFRQPAMPKVPNPKKPNR